MHLTHQIIGAQHTPHGIGKSQRHSHRQSFRHRHHDERHRNHAGLQEISAESHPVELGDSVARCKINNHTSHNDKPGYQIAEAGNHVSESFELYRKRSLYAIVDLRGLEHAAVLGSVANGRNRHHTMSFHHLCAAHHHIRGESRIRVELLGISSLGTERLAGQSRFVDVELRRLEQASVGRDFVAGI